MIGYKLEVKHDGDFYHERPYNIILHENKQEAIDLIIQALQVVHDTFSTSKSYLNIIKVHIGKFLNAYHSDVTSYEDDKYDIWFVRQKNLFEFEFDLDNGNQRISIYPYNLDVQMKNNAIYITEDKELGYF